MTPATELVQRCIETAAATLTFQEKICALSKALAMGLEDPRKWLMGASSDALSAFLER